MKCPVCDKEVGGLYSSTYPIVISPRCGYCYGKVGGKTLREIENERKRSAKGGSDDPR